VFWSHTNDRRFWNANVPRVRMIVF
jgi:hypothetical protein